MSEANLAAQMEWSGTSRTQIGLFEVAYTDFTELLYADGTRKAYLMPIIGHTCKLAYGWAVGKRANADLAFEAWEVATATFQQLGIPYAGMIVHHDQDSVYTGYRWTGRLLLEDGVRLSYTLNGAKDNPEMESFNGRFKTEGRSLFLDAQSRWWGARGRNSRPLDEQARGCKLPPLSRNSYTQVPPTPGILIYEGANGSPSVPRGHHEWSIWPLPLGGGSDEAATESETRNPRQS